MNYFFFRLSLTDCLSTGLDQYGELHFGLAHLNGFNISPSLVTSVRCVIISFQKDLSIAMNLNVIVYVGKFN